MKEKLVGFLEEERDAGWQADLPWKGSAALSPIFKKNATEHIKHVVTLKAKPRGMCGNYETARNRGGSRERVRRLNRADALLACGTLNPNWSEESSPHAFKLLS